MKLYLVTPPNEEGGYDMEYLVTAEGPAQAVHLLQKHLDGREGDHEQLNNFDLTSEEVWIARELPPADAPCRAEVHDWSDCAFTFWEKLP